MGSDGIEGNDQVRLVGRIAWAHDRRRIHRAKNHNWTGIGPHVSMSENADEVLLMHPSRMADGRGFDPLEGIVSR